MATKSTVAQLERHVGHTPGPWEAVEDSILADDGCVQIATVPLFDGTNPTEWQANLRLVSAAPDLLAACRAAFADLDAAFHGRKPPMKQLDLSRLLRDVITKAEGVK